MSLIYLQNHNGIMDLKEEEKDKNILYVGFAYSYTRPNNINLI